MDGAKHQRVLEDLRDLIIDTVTVPTAQRLHQAEKLCRYTRAIAGLNATRVDAVGIEPWDDVLGDDYQPAGAIRAMNPRGPNDLIDVFRDMIPQVLELYKKPANPVGDLDRLLSVRDRLVATGQDVSALDARIATETAALTSQPAMPTGENLGEYPAVVHPEFLRGRAPATHVGDVLHAGGREADGARADGVGDAVADGRQEEVDGRPAR